MTDECLELQNIEYQTMLLNSNNKIVSTKKDTDNIDHFLDNEMQNSYNKPWNKLSNHIKTKMFYDFVETNSIENKYDNKTKLELLKYLKKCTERKKLLKIKDVVYDKENGVIKSIPTLLFDAVRQRFTLKVVDRKKTSLKSLAPSRRNKTNKKIFNKKGLPNKVLNKKGLSNKTIDDI
tara:strand:+ start:14823 stop:15356 length:534 start_codon:yes stop_codon:yes gene_type:complete